MYVDFSTSTKEKSKIVVYIDSNTHVKRGSWMSRKFFFRVFHVF